MLFLLLAVLSISVSYGQTCKGYLAQCDKLTFPKHNEYCCKKKGKCPDGMVDAEREGKTVCKAPAAPTPAPTTAAPTVYKDPCSHSKAPYNSKCKKAKEEGQCCRFNPKKYKDTKGCPEGFTVGNSEKVNEKKTKKSGKTVLLGKVCVYGEAEDKTNYDCAKGFAARCEKTLNVGECCDDLETEGKCPDAVKDQYSVVYSTAHHREVCKLDKSKGRVIKCENFVELCKKATEKNQCCDDFATQGKCPDNYEQVMDSVREKAVCACVQCGSDGTPAPTREGVNCEGKIDGKDKWLAQCKNVEVKGQCCDDLKKNGECPKGYGIYWSTDRTRDVCVKTS